MPSTHLSFNYHSVFSTKNREPILPASWRAELHAYLGGILRDLGRRGTGGRRSGRSRAFSSAIIGSPPAGWSGRLEFQGFAKSAHPWLSSSSSSGAENPSFASA